MAMRGGLAKCRTELMRLLEGYALSGGLPVEADRMVVRKLHSQCDGVFFFVLFNAVG